MSTIIAEPPHTGEPSFVDQVAGLTNPSAIVDALPPTASEHLVIELRTAANDNNRSTAMRSHLSRAADIVAAAIDAIGRLRSSGSFAEYVAFFVDNRWLGTAEVSHLAQRIVEHELTHGVAESPLALGLKAAEQASVLCAALSQYLASREAYAQLVTGKVPEQELFSDHFLQWMKARAFRATHYEQNEELASRYWEGVEVLFYARWVQHRLRNWNGGLPSSASQSEQWWIVHPTLFVLVRSVCDESVVISEAERRLTRVLRSIKTPDGLPPPTHRMCRRMARSSLAQALIQTFEPRWVVEGIMLFRQTVLDDGAPTSDAGRLTLVLRYLTAAVVHWPASSDPRAQLEDSEALASSSLEVTNIETNPRIFRDLLQLRARVRRELSRWLPSKLGEALLDFERSLRVPNVSYEREARARALCDFASALRSSKPEDVEVREQARLMYIESLALLGDEWAATKATVLLSLAQLYNESRADSAWREQERSLEALDRALALLDQDEPNDPDSSHIRQLRASLLLTRGNTLKLRAVGDLWHGARDAYSAALATLRAEDGPDIRGHIRLALGALHLDYAAGDRTRLDTALRNIDEAVDCLDGNALVRAHALIIRAQVHSHPLVGDIANAHRDVAEAEHVYAAWEDTRGQASAHLVRAAILVRSADLGERIASTGRFLKAAEGFMAAGESHRAMSAWAAAARQLVRNATATNDTSLLPQAEAAYHRAIEIAEASWATVASAGERLYTAGDIHDLWSEVLWVKATVGQDMSQLSMAAMRAKGRGALSANAELLAMREVEPEQSTQSDEYRRLSRVFDEVLYRRSDGETASLAAETDAMVEATEELRRILSIDAHTWTTEQHVSFEVHFRDWLARHPHVVLCDVTISAHGCVVLVAGAKAGFEAFLLPVSTQTIRRWVTAWSKAYSNRESDEDAWYSKVDAFLAELASHIWHPLSDSLSHYTTAVVVPDLLSNLPIHSALTIETSGRLGVILTNHASFVFDALTPAFVDAESALCILSDPAVLASHQLRAAQQEVIDVATLFSQHGIDTTVSASVGRLSGADAFPSEAATAPDAITLTTNRPTPEWVSQSIAAHDAIFYTGHAKSDGLYEAKLNLVAADGAPSNLDILSLASSARLLRRPSVILSACETATSGEHSSESLSIAAAFHQLGARLVLGTQWVVGASAARIATTTFVAASLRGDDPATALRTAIAAVRAKFPEPAAWAGLCVSTMG